MRVTEHDHQYEIAKERTSRLW